MYIREQTKSFFSISFSLQTLFFLGTVEQPHLAISITLVTFPAPVVCHFQVSLSKALNPELPCYELGVCSDGIQ